MTATDQLPPERRRALIVLTEDQVRVARRDSDLQELYDSSEASLILFPGPDEDISRDALRTRLRRSGRLRPGSLLVQSPFDIDHYEFADVAVTEFAVTKFMYLSQLCKLLGAKSVTVEQIHAVKRTTKTSTKASGNVRAATVTTEVDTEFEERIRARLKVADEFPGAPKDIDAANHFLVKHGLDHDPKLASLVALREGDNALRKRHIVISLTQESNENLVVAASLSGLKIVKVKADFVRTENEELEITLEASITF